MPDALDGDFSRSRAVLVGTWNYQHLSPVPAAEHSLYRMRDLLISPLCGWPEDRVRVIANPLTPSGVLDDLVTWFREAADVSLFYYVGHGQYNDRGELCLALVGTSEDPHRRSFTSLNYHQVRDAFHAGHAATEIAVLDCCHAGLAASAGALGPQTLDPPPARGFYLMMASSELSVARFESAAVEGAGPQTYFTKYLADTVERGIPGQPEGLALGAIFDRVASTMTRIGLPEPRHSSGDHAGHFVFARNAAQRDIEPALPAAASIVPVPPLSVSAARPSLYQRRAVVATTAAAVAALGAGSWLLAGRQSARPPEVPGAAASLDGSARATTDSTSTREITAAVSLGEPNTIGAAVLSVAFSIDGRILACGTDNNDVELWNVAEPAHPTRLGQPLSGPENSVLTVAFSPDRHTLACGSYDATIRLWGISDLTAPIALGQPLTAGEGHGVTTVAFSPSGHTLASGGYDPTIRLWNATDPTRPTLVGQPLTGHTDTVTSVVFSPDGRILASASHDNTVRLWNVADPADPAPLGPPLVGHDATVNCVVFTHDGRILASAGDDKMIRLWSVADPARAAPLGQPLAGHAKSVESVAGYPLGNTLASGADDGTVRLWNVTDPARPTRLGPLLGHTGTVKSVAFSPDGSTLASGGSDSTFRLWHLNS